MPIDVSGKGTKEHPWVLTTPPGSSVFTAYRDEMSDPPALVVQVGATQLKYYLRSLNDLHKMLIDSGDWVVACPRFVYHGIS